MEVLKAHIDSSLQLRAEAEDRIIWKGDASGNFSIKSLSEWCNSLLGSNQRLMTFIWESTAPLKVKCFTWLALLGRIKSGELLLRYGLLQNVAECTSVFSVEIILKLPTI